MEKEIFRNNPGHADCDCIICRQKNNPASDEHIIPKALGGVMHTWNVCKECNSRLGEKIDPYLTNNFLSVMERHLHQLKGQSNQRVKTPLEDTLIADDGFRYRVEYKNGRFEPYLLPHFNIDKDAQLGRLTLDSRDAARAAEIMKKFCKRNKLSFDKDKLKISDPEERPSPKFQYRIQVDIEHFKLAILKIAYEFAVTLFPDRISDRQMKKIRKSLRLIIYDRMKPDKIDKTLFGGDGFRDFFPQMLGKLIDFGNKKRHYLFLMNLRGEVWCIVRLFSAFCLTIKLSEVEWPEIGEGILAVNDFGTHTYDLMTLSELINKVSQHLDPVWIGPQGRIDVSQTLKYPDGHPIIIEPLSKNVMCMRDIYDIIRNLPESKIIDRHSNDMYLTTYNLDGHYFVCDSLTGQFQPILTITLRTRVHKY